MKFPLREKKLSSASNHALNGVTGMGQGLSSSLLDSPKPSAERPQGLPLTVAEKLPLARVSDAAHSTGSDKCHCARVCRIAVQPRNMLYFYLHLV